MGKSYISIRCRASVRSKLVIRTNIVLLGGKEYYNNRSAASTANTRAKVTVSRAKPTYEGEIDDLLSNLKDIIPTPGYLRHCFWLT